MLVRKTTICALTSRTGVLWKQRFQMPIVPPDPGRLACWIAVATVLVCGNAFSQGGRTPGTVTQVEAARPLTVWHPMAVRLEGPAHSETDDDPNPFLDYRLEVRFTAPSGKMFSVAGFFDGDGKGAARGNVWRARFTPCEPGAWSYHVSFRRGARVAIDLAAEAGQSLSPNGTSGRFDVARRNPQAPGFLRWGLLEYVGGHYLKFRNGPYWIKTGTDTPENFLAYAGFDNTPPSHDYDVHVRHWNPGDPDWSSGRGKGIIGALNYLAAERVNSIYFMPMNVGGDGKDVWPWTGRPDGKGSPDNDNLHFDTGKLAQWNTVFEHAQRRGIFLHFALNEAERENKRELDDGELGVERKLYYRELVARFGHHLALEWNLCEEYNIGGLDLGADRVCRFADYIRVLDPYGHPITVHSAGDPVKALAFTFGDPRFSLTSIQLNQRRIDEVTEAIRQATIDAGRPLPVALDEFTVDAGTNKSYMPVDNAELHRKQKLWPTLFSGGTIEFILEGLLEVDRFDTPNRKLLWQYCWHARRLMEEQLPFWEMAPADVLVKGAATIEVGTGGGKSSRMGPQVLAKAGEVYAVYLPCASESGTIRLAANGAPYRKRWYNPRDGRFEGPQEEVSVVDSAVKIGAPPEDPGEDWVVLFHSARRSGQERNAKSARVFPGKDWQTIDPAELSLDAARLDALAKRLGGRGCVVKHGYVVKSWGSQAQLSDWYSSAKPVLSTLLMFALKEEKISGFDARLSEFGWDLKPKDRMMTFRHLAGMTSGYGRPESPGAAWAYNDFAIQLYQRTLFDRVFREDPAKVANAPERFGALGLQDGLEFREKNRRLSASVRDFTRIAWFWLNRGNWHGKQLLPRDYFDENMRPQVAIDLPHTQNADTDDYLKVGSFGGGSDHFTKFGAGIYGFNWWFNRPGRLHPDSRTWPDAPGDIVMSVGFGGNCTALAPGQDAILVAARANWGNLEAGQSESEMNQVLRDFAEAVTGE